MSVPAEVRAIIGQTVFRVSTGEADIHVAATKPNFRSSDRINH
jgi:hypothetical protein